jgi:hypothetical protein
MVTGSSGLRLYDLDKKEKVHTICEDQKSIAMIR